MNHLKSKTTKTLRSITLMLAALLSLSSCGSVFDDLEPCPTGVSMRFVYDYNLEEANAFASQVDCLVLYLYDSAGHLLTTVTPPASSLADENWRLQLDLEPGTYHAIAYGGITCDKASFAHQNEPTTGSDYREISMNLKDSHIGTLLHDHFHGALRFTIENDGTDYTMVTMNMTKTTNHFRILLKQLNDLPVNGDDYEFYITDDNKELDHTNTPVRSGQNISYPSWVTGQVEDVGFGELSTSRLHLSTEPHLIVKRKPDAEARSESADDARTIIDLPINTYLIMAKPLSKDWGNQEYLDRCSLWNMTFFLDKNLEWSKTEIIINKWTVRIRDIEMR